MRYSVNRSERASVLWVRLRKFLRILLVSRLDNPTGQDCTCRWKRFAWLSKDTAVRCRTGLHGRDVKRALGLMGYSVGLGLE